MRLIEVVYTSTKPARTVRELIEHSIGGPTPVELSVTEVSSTEEKMIAVTFSAFVEHGHSAVGVDTEGKEVVVFLGSVEETDVKQPTIVVGSPQSKDTL